MDKLKNAKHEIFKAQDFTYRKYVREALSDKKAEGSTDAGKEIHHLCESGVSQLKHLLITILQGMEQGPRSQRRELEDIKHSLVFPVEPPGNSLVVQWLGLGAFTDEGLGSTPGWGIKILKVTQCSQKKEKTLNIFSTEKFHDFMRLMQMLMRNRLQIFNFHFPTSNPLTGNSMKTFSREQSLQFPAFVLALPGSLLHEVYH